MKLVALLALFAVVVASAATTAAAASKTLQSDARLDAIASGIAGFPVTVAGEDNSADWTAMAPTLPNGETDGYTYLAPTDPNYRTIFLSPNAWSTLEGVESTGLANVSIPGRSSAADAIMTLTHEAFHQKLNSTDEGRVNACALQAFPDVISTYFGVTATIEKTVTTTRTVKVRRLVWVRLHGRRVHRWRSVPKIVRTTSTAEVRNPVYDILVANARADYQSQPPPYSTGSCS